MPGTLYLRSHFLASLSLWDLPILKRMLRSLSNRSSCSVASLRQMSAREYCCLFKAKELVRSSTCLPIHVHFDSQGQANIGSGLLVKWSSTLISL